MFKDFIKEIRFEESKCKKITLSKFKKEFDFFNDFLYFYVDQIRMTRICKNSHFSTQESAIFMLNVRIIKSFLCANNLLKMGYYNEAIVIQRSIYESINLCKYIIKNPKSAEKWSKGERFSPSVVAKDLVISPEMNKIYGIFCEFTHPNVASVSDLITVEKRSLCHADFQEKDTMITHTCSIFNKELAHASIKYQLLFIQMASDDFFEFFMKHHSKDVNELHLKLRKEFQSRIVKIAALWREDIEK